MTECSILVIHCFFTDNHPFREKERLAAAHPSLIGNATLLAGTSTGGLIALGLANGMTPADLRRLYQDSGASIFDNSGRLSLGGKLRSKYSNDNLKETVSGIFGNLTLGDLAKEVLVPSFDLDADTDTPARGWKAKFFTNRAGDKDRAVPVADVALGTGTSFRWLDSTDGEWGAIDWIRDGRIMDLMIEGVGDVADFQCRQILEDKYKRVAPVFPDDVVVDLDDDGKIDYLVAYANEFEIGPALQWLAQVAW